MYTCVANSLRHSVMEYNTQRAVIRTDRPQKNIVRRVAESHSTRRSSGFRFLCVHAHAFSKIIPHSTLRVYTILCIILMYR